MSDPISILILFVLMLFLIYLSGWFSGTETALTTITPAQVALMRKQEVKNVEYVLKLKQDMDRTLITILIGNNLVNIVLSSIAALVANALFHTIGVSIMIGVITFLIIVFGEITPKSHAISKTRTIVLKRAFPLYFMMRVLGPLVSLMLFITEKLLGWHGVSKSRRKTVVSDASIMSLASLGEEEGVIKGIERDIIHRVFSFGDKKVRSIMLPMKDVFWLKKKTTIQEAKRELSETGFTRVPVKDHEKIIGILYSKDLLDKTEGPIAPILRKSVDVAAKADITQLFYLMKNHRIHLAIVRNDMGKAIGIVTLEDILEELVGKIHDEFDE